MRYYETRTYKQKYLNLRSKMREFVKSHNIEITEEIVKILGIKSRPSKNYE